MITGWLIKIVVVIALVGVVVVEVSSPLITKAQVDSAAHDAADEASLDYLNGHNVDRAQQVAQADADKDHATLEHFELDPDTGKVTVTLFKQARSFILKKFTQTRKWTEVRVTATSSGSAK